MKVLCLMKRPDLVRRLEAAFHPANFIADTVSTVQECLEYAARFIYSGFVIDAESIDYLEARELTGRLRHLYPCSALVLIERYFDLGQRLNLFEAGADECVKDPFHVSELTVRLSLLIRLRRGAVQAVSSLRLGELELNLVKRTVKRMGRDIELRPKEFLLLEYLVRNARTAVTRTMIIEHVWNSSFEGLTNVVDVYISALRAKIDRGFSRPMIQTARGVGYTISKPETMPLRKEIESGELALAI